MPSYKKHSKKKTHPWYRNHWDKITYLAILGIFLCFLPGQNVYTVEKLRELPSIRPRPFELPPLSMYPVNVTGVYPAADITATGLIIMDVNSGVVMYKRNEDVELSPASTTKILTALVALDLYNLDDVVTVKSVMNDGQVMGLVPGETMTVENLLYGALIHSGNDAAWALADYYPGGQSAFVAAMNRKAQALHLSHSTFTNPVGFDDPNHKTTPMDLARLASVALQNKVIAKMVAIPQITISDTTHTYFHSLKNVNELLGKIPGVGGIKTGWTEEAGENLITLIDRNGHHVIIVLLHSQDRFGETSKIIDWIFSNYHWDKITPLPTPN